MTDMNKETASEGSGTLELLMDLELPVNIAFYKCLEALANLGRASSISSRRERHLDHLY